MSATAVCVRCGDPLPARRGSRRLYCEPRCRRLLELDLRKERRVAVWLAWRVYRLAVTAGEEAQTWRARAAKADPEWGSYQGETLAVARRAVTFWEAESARLDADLATVLGRPADR